MGALDFFGKNKHVSDEDLRRQRQNQALYEGLSEQGLERTAEDAKQHAEFMSDMQVFSGLYSNDLPMQSLKFAYQEDEKADRKRVQKDMDDFTRSLIDDSGGVTDEAKRVRDEYGVIVKPHMNLITGELTTEDITAWEARDAMAYTRGNMNALSTTEQASLYTTTLKYAGNSTIFGSLEDKHPEFFGVSQEEREFIGDNLKYQGSWHRMFDIQTPGREDEESGFWNTVNPLNVFNPLDVPNKIRELSIGQNVVSWFGNTLPTDVLGGKKQEGWDPMKAWDLVEKYHPGFAAYVTQEAGLSLLTLGQTPNHWEFRYAINNAVQLSSLSQTINVASSDNNWVDNMAVYGWNFLRQSFRSGDMPLELGLTIVTVGGYGAVSLGSSAAKGAVRGASRAILRDGASVTLSRAGRAAAATHRGNRNRRWFRKAQAYALPSNWGHIVANGGKLKGLEWGRSGGLLNNLGRMAAIDAAQGTVEGFLYGLQNQLTGGTEGINWDRMWTETYQEAIGQIVFGKLFRGANLTAMHVADYANVKGGGNMLWKHVARSLPKGVKERVELEARLRDPNLTLEELEMAHLSALLQAQQHTAWGMLVGDDNQGMPPVVAQMLNTIRQAAHQNGVDFDTVSIMERLVQEATQMAGESENSRAVAGGRAGLVLSSTAVFDENAASLLIVTAAVDNLRAQGIRIDGEENKAVFNGFVKGLVIQDKLKERGFDLNDTSRGRDEAIQEIEIEIGNNPEILQEAWQNVEEAANQLKEWRHQADPENNPLVTSIDPNEQAVVLELREILKDEDGNFDRNLLNDIVDRNIEIDGDLNIRDEVIEAVFLGGEATATDAATGETETDAGETAAETESDLNLTDKEKLVIDELALIKEFEAYRRSRSDFDPRC